MMDYEEFVLPAFLGAVLFLLLSPGYYLGLKKQTVEDIAREHPERIWMSHTTSNDNVYIHGAIFLGVFLLSLYGIKFWLKQKCE